MCVKKCRCSADDGRRLLQLLHRHQPVHAGTACQQSPGCALPGTPGTCRPIPAGMIDPDGRCAPVCNGDGYLEIGMQFLPDVMVKCSQCGGRRYRPEILKIKYRGRDIADVLDLTVREAFTFFRGQTKVQARHWCDAIYRHHGAATMSSTRRPPRDASSGRSTTT